MNELENAYERGTFGVSRRTFMKLAGVAGVTAMGGMLVFPDNEAHALYTEPAEQHWDELSGDKVRFTVHSDTHFRGCDVQKKFPLAFQSIYDNVPNVAAHVFDGDSTDNGNDAEYAELVEYINTYLQKPPIICMGNHEMYAHGSNLPEAIQSFKDKVLAKITVPDTPQAPGGTHEGLEHFAGKVGGEDGYWLIAASCGLNYDYGYDIPTEGYDQPTPIQWMLENIDAAVQEDPTKPVFVFTHHPMPETMHFSPESFGAGWIGQFTDDQYPGQYDFQNYIAEHYPQVIHFSGHTHIPDNDPRSIWQDGFTAVQTATFGNNFWMEGGANKDGYDAQGGTGGHPADGYDASQCLLVEVDPSNGHEVTIRRMDFREGDYIGRPWTFKVSDKSTWIYDNATMEAASKAPVVPEDAKVVMGISEPEPGQKVDVSFTIPADKVTPDTSGLSDDIVMSYRIVIHSAADPQGEAVYDACYMSDYYKAAQNRPAEFTRPLFGASLDAGDYVITAYARNPWLKETQIGEAVEFTIPEIAALPMTALLAVNFADGDASDDSELAHAVAAYGNPSYVEESAFGGKLVANFDGSSSYGYQFTEDDYAKLATSTTMEILLQFTETPSSGYKDVFSSGDKTGQWLEYYPDATLRHYYNDGSTNTRAEVPAGEWAHIVCTYDGAVMRYYKNGKLVDETSQAGSIQPPVVSEDKYRWFIGSDISDKGEPQAQCKAKVAFANLYYGTVADQSAVDQMYAAAAVCTIKPPAEGAFGEPEVGKLCVLPVVMATDVNGNQIQAKPSVVAPDGTEVELSRIEDGETSTQTDAISYGFTPTQEGCHSVTYTAGYGATWAATFAVAAASVPDPDQPGTDPDQPGTDPDNPGTDPDQPGTDPDQPGTGDDKPSGDGNQGGSDKPSTGDDKPTDQGSSDKPDTDNNSGSNSDPDNGGSLPKTADPMGVVTTAVGAMAAVATVALGAAGALSKKLGFADSNDSQE